MQCDEICNNLKFHHITLTLFRRQHPSGPYLKIELSFICFNLVFNYEYEASRVKTVPLFEGI